jgi:hypothetical protein
VIGRAAVKLVCVIVIGVVAAGACTKTTGKVMLGVGGAATVGTLVALGARDCAGEDACESPRAEAFVLPVALAVTLHGFLVWATSDRPEPAPAAPSSARAPHRGPACVSDAPLADCLAAVTAAGQPGGQ